MAKQIEFCFHAHLLNQNQSGVLIDKKMSGIAGINAAGNSHHSSKQRNRTCYPIGLLQLKINLDKQANIELIITEGD